MLLLILPLHITSGFAQNENVFNLKGRDIIPTPVLTHVGNDYNCVYNKSINKQWVYVIGMYLYFEDKTLLTSIQD